MSVTADTLVQHELIGLGVTVVSASDPDIIGIEGEVVTETTRTLAVETDGRIAHVPKDSATFEWTLPSGEVVRTAGEQLLARPARRTEQTGDSKWR